MRLSKLFRTRKSRKYPIKRDGEGRSLRARRYMQEANKYREEEDAEIIEAGDKMTHSGR